VALLIDSAGDTAGMQCRAYPPRGGGGESGGCGVWEGGGVIISRGRKGAVDLGGIVLQGTGREFLRVSSAFLWAMVAFGLFVRLFGGSFVVGLGTG